MASRPPVAPDRVRDAVARLLGSTCFAAARRGRELLAYLVEAVLAGRAGAVSEYAIAQDVFGRNQDFDPRIDTCVRTEAWRLRKRLRDYYLGEGEAETLRIAFAARSIVPHFVEQVGSCDAVVRRFAVYVDVPGNDGFAAHLRDDILNGLAGVPHVSPHVASGGMPEQGFRLSCHLHRDGPSLRMIATLVQADSGEVRAAESFSGDFLAPGRVSGAVVRMTAEALAGRCASFPVDILDAIGKMHYVDAMLRGSVADRSQRLTALRCAVRQYDRLATQDPADLMAQRRLIAGLGLMLVMVPSATLPLLPRLAAAASAALALDASLAEIWLTLGLAHNYAYDWTSAERAYRTAIALDPLDPSPYVLLAFSYLQTGRIDKALDAAETAGALDPLSPMVASSIGLALNHAKRFEEAADVAAHALAGAPDFPRLRVILGDSRMHAGKFDAAIQELTSAREHLHQDPLVCGLLGLACARGGEPDRARGLLAELESAPDPTARDPAAAAMIHIGLGAPEQALDALGQAVRRRGTPGLFFGSAAFDPLRSAGRFRALQREMGVAVG